MRRLCLLLAGLGVCVLAAAQYPGFVRLNNEAAFRQAFAKAAASTGSIKSDFVQEKNMSMLADKITSRGKFWFKKDNRVRMEYLQPFSYLMILNNGKIFVKDGQKENKVNANSSKLFQQVNRILVDCVGGTVLSNPDFRTQVWESPKAYLVELLPVAKNLKALYQKINIYISKKDYTADSIDMVELSGDNSNVRFTNKELNASIPDALFVIP